MENNFAPAEYGGYVLGAKGGGGSQITVEPLSVTENGVYTAEEGTAYSPVTVNVSASSPFDEWLGVTDYAEVTLNYTFPEDSPDTEITGGSYDIQIGTFDEWGNLFPIYQFTIMNSELIEGTESIRIIVPLISGQITALSNFALDGDEGGYYQPRFNTAIYSENISYENYLVVISGDGTITTTLVSA